MKIETDFINHCAPVLIGIKPASMFSVKTKNHPHLQQEITSINDTLKQNGLRVRQIMRCETYSLLFVYRPIDLENLLFASKISEYLEICGYDMSGNLESVLFELFLKLSCEKDFPHEVGVFLGYPLEDILGFVKHKGRNYKSFGYWKVYSDEKKAKTLFSEYDRCKEKLVSLYKQGTSFNQLCVAS